MTTASPAAGDYDAYASQYAANVAWREQGGVDGEPFGLLPPLLELLGNIIGCRVLDAGCGEGYLARALATRQARVTGIDLSPRLIELARIKDPRRFPPTRCLPSRRRALPRFLLLAFSKQRPGLEDHDLRLVYQVHPARVSKRAEHDIAVLKRLSRSSARYPL